MSGLDALRGELGALTFARVTKMVFDDKHVVSKEGEDRTFSHFCGFSRTLDDNKKSVWFKKINHLPKMHIGPVIFETELARYTDYPRAGDILVGIVRPSPKGDVFIWWVHRARPILELSNILKQEAHFSRILRQASRTYNRLGQSDDLYLFARSVMGDTEPLVAQLLPQDKRPRHPVRKDATGYQRKRGFSVAREPITFAFYTALICRDPTVFQSVISAASTLDNVSAGKYTLERLQHMIDTARPFE